MDNYARNDGAADQAPDVYPDYRMQDWAQKTGTSTTQQKSKPLHDRLKEANNRADSIAELLMALTRAVLPPMPTDAVDAEGCETLKDSTVSGEIDDLIQTLCLISGKVSRLSVAITGAA